MNRNYLRSINHVWIDFAVLCAIIIAIALLYLPSLIYPFVWHEADDLSRTLRYTPVQYFNGMPSYEYYRPLMFLFWRSILDAWGAGSAIIFHAYSIALHVLNAVLLFALARALVRSRPIAAAAALIFVCFPFGYQAITWSTAHFHPMVLLFVLACLLIYTRTRLAQLRGQSKRLTYLGYFAAAISLIIGILVHETAFVTAPILILVEAYLVINRRVPRRSLWPLAYLAITFVMFGLYLITAKSPPIEKTFDIKAGLYLLQGLSYPAAMILARACTLPACDSVTWLPAIIVLTVLIMLWLWRSGRTITLGLLGLIWFVLGVAPAWAGRDFTYISYAPRLVYFAGAGASLAIASILGTSAAPGRLIRIGIMGLIVLQSGLFVIERQPLYAKAFQLVEQENQAMFAPRQGKAIFINAVDLFAYPQLEFPLGWTGVPVAPWHNQLGVTSNLRTEGDADWIIDPARSAEVQAGAHLQLEFHGRVLPSSQAQAEIVAARDVYQVEAARSDLHLFKVASIEHTLQPAPFIIEWLKSLRLVSAAIEEEDGVPVLNLDWSIAGPIDQNQTVFVHIRNAAGEVVAQADGDPIDGLAPFNLWATGDLIHERRPLTLPEQLPAGTYTVAIGLYDRGTLQRDAPTQLNGITATDNAAVVATFNH